MKNYTIILFALFSFLSSKNIFAQGWEVVFPDSMAWSQAFDVKPTPDGGFIVVGETDFPTGAIRHYVRAVKTDGLGQIEWSEIYNVGAVTDDRAKSVEIADDSYFVSGSQNSDYYLMKIDLEGDTIWTKTYGTGAPEFFNGSVLTDDDHLVITGFKAGIDDSFVSLHKIDFDGNIIWENIYTTAVGPFFFGTGNSVIQTNDGGYLITGGGDGQLMLLKTDASGNELWTQFHQFSTSDGGNAVIETADGDFIVGGSISGFAGDAPLLSRYNANGDLVWQSMDFPVGLGRITSMDETDDGNIIVIGSLQEFWSGTGNGFIAKFTLDGNLLWTQNLSNSTATGAAVHQLDSGGFILAGSKTGPQTGMWLARTDGFGNSFTNLVTGTIFNDNSNDCLPQMEEDSLKNWLIEISGNFGTLYASTNNTGQYSIQLDTGEYVFKPIAPNDYWAFCENEVDVSLTEFYDTTQLDFGANSLYDCPFLSVDISAPLLRFCQTNNYYVNYCNNGTVTAEDAFIEVQLDEFMTYENSSIPLSSQIDNTLIFDLGDIAIGECGNFWIQAFLDCDVTLGQVHCTEAQIFPDTICTPIPTIDVLEIEMDVDCQNDSIYLIIQNVGNIPMTEFSEFIVIEDDVMYLHDENFQLGVGETFTFVVPANGSTFYFNSPVSGNSVTIEGCGMNAMGGFNTGFFTQFEENDFSPTLSIDCQENIGAYDPNDKRANPVGYRSEHFIERGTDLEYHIRFQNTGTDTAFKVILIDTLSQHLDITSFRAGASSHDYEWEIYGNGILKFTYDNILLVDSTTNEPGSHGFVKYRISQKPDLPNGTIIYNAADIYFDFNEPVYTGQVFHTIGEDFFVNDKEVFIPNIEMNVYPNPAHEKATFEIIGMDLENAEFQLFDINGRLTRSDSFNGNQFEFYRRGLPSGFYIFKIIENDVLIGSGKIILN